tara:strand:+ start:590 stop:781 length:192 start_codon:yes stop_codon:yes gene_type:complete
MAVRKAWDEKWEEGKCTFEKGASESRFIWVGEESGLVFEWSLKTDGRRDEDDWKDVYRIPSDF